ncbi:ParB/RepB/Spo0J family partition protein [Agromyces marinus]|uniref:Chromosome partitioning protein ParB n=1 Tax=Agromyces marinus TaxID=1389020 RepID=A0ABM8H1X0_9MICO|nr:ParB/RepB/Spo0J family partition protein [Agromyces marinus]UIP60099.1 putative chromosome-partitioning protein ParB [Agromyces marinus]BDZ54781.1 chromosome partitioning protein ParB [Agromyces marinus]
MATKRTGLGRGIGALIPTVTEEAPRANRPVDVFFPESDVPAAAMAAVAQAAEANLVTVPGAHLARLDPADVLPNAQQPRTVFDEDDLAELVHSIKEFGVLQPIVVRPHPVDAGKYELVMGERRLRATKAAGLDTIPAVVKDTADEAMLRDALLENLHRSQLNPLEEASAYQQLLADFGITQEELATRIGRSRPQISNTLRLLKLPEPIQVRVAAGVLSAGHARAILAAGDAEAMQRLADKIVNEDLSVRAAEAIAAQAPKAPRQKPAAGKRQEFLDDLSTRLGDRLDTRVKISLGARKGRINIDFATVQDLRRILSELGENLDGL